MIGTRSGRQVGHAERPATRALSFGHKEHKDHKEFLFVLLSGLCGLRLRAFRGLPPQRPGETGVVRSLDDERIAIKASD